jgi:hypothetical protein
MFESRWRQQHQQLIHTICKLVQCCSPLVIHKAREELGAGNKGFKAAAAQYRRQQQQQLLQVGCISTPAWSSAARRLSLAKPQKTWHLQKTAPAAAVEY